MRQTQNTQKNSNKKSVFVIALLLLLVAVIGFGGYTMSKYISSKSDKGTANVAKWGFTVSADASKLFGSNYEMKSGAASSTVTTEADATKLTVKASNADSKVVAPGTTGSMTFSIDGTAEVRSKIEVSLTGNDVVLKYTATGVANGEYAPVKWTLKKKGETEALVNNVSFKALQDELAKLSETVNANAEYTKKGEYTIEWAWAFETGSDDTEKTLNNKLDTFLGAIANKSDTTKDATNTYTKAEGTSTTINFNLSVSVTQLKGDEE